MTDLSFIFGEDASDSEALHLEEPKTTRIQQVAPGPYSRPQRVIQFLQSLTVPDGPRAGLQFVLDPFQIDMVYEIYTRDKHDQRIVNDVTFTVARKNGKTGFMGGLGLCHLCGPEAVLYGQLYSFAFDREQAAVIYNYMLNMVYADAHLSSLLIPTESSKKLVDPTSRSTFVSLSAENRSKHGKSTSFLLGDELAQFGADRTLYDTLRTSMGSHGRNALSVVISTQAASDNTLMSELVDYGMAVNAGEIEDPHTKTFVYVTPKDREDAEKYGLEDKVHYIKDDEGNDTDEVDPFDEHNWQFSNPGLDTIRSRFEIQQMAKKAQLMPSAEVSFRNLYLNQRVEAEAPFLTRAVWLACKGVKEPFTLEQFEGRDCYGGLDLSGRRDLTSLILAFPDPDDLENGPIDLVCYFWTPAQDLSERAKQDKVPYDRWADKGYLEAVPGHTIDYGYVAKKIQEIDATVNMKQLGFDRWRIRDMKRELNEIGLDEYAEEESEIMVPYGQGFKDMNPAVEITEEWALAQRIRHGGHPVLTWCVGNTVVEIDPAENRKFTKRKSKGRIDGTVALSMALRMFEISQEEPEDDGSITVIG